MGSNYYKRSNIGQKLRGIFSIHFRDFKLELTSIFLS